MRKRSLFFTSLTAAIASVAIGASIAMADSVPAVNADSATTSLGTPVTINVLANDTNPIGTFQAASVAITTAPTNGTAVVDNNTGDVTYTPASAFTGQDAFVYQACDDEATPFCGSATVTVTVTGAVAATPTPEGPTESWPITHPDSASTMAGTPVSINVLANDEGPIYALDPTTLTVVTQPANGTTAVDTSSGAITYTPAAGFTGTDTFTYQICDVQTTAHCSPGNVTVGVFAAPTATPTTATPPPADTSTPAPTATTPISSTTAGANAVTPLPPSTGSGVNAAGSGHTTGIVLLALVGIATVGALGALTGFSLTSRRR